MSRLIESNAVKSAATAALAVIGAMLCVVAIAGLSELAFYLHRAGGIRAVLASFTVLVFLLLWAISWANLRARTLSQGGKK